MTADNAKKIGYTKVKAEVKAKGLREFAEDIVLR